MRKGERLWPLGPGKYGAQAERILREIGGSLCVVITDGPRGPGFDVYSTRPGQLLLLPTILRDVAAQIEADLTRPASDG